MVSWRPSAWGFVCAALCLQVSVPPRAHGSAAVVDSLTLQRPANVEVWRKYNDARRLFTVYITWDDIPDSAGAFIHPADASFWAVTTSPDSIAYPESGGEYSGTIDRTISFRAIEGGTVGSGLITLRYDIIGEERWSNTKNIGAGYTPDTWIDLDFEDQLSDSVLSLGLRVRFPRGIVDAQGQFKICCEDFEGFHVWRGIEPDGSDLEIIAELSKEEANRGEGPGGSVTDLVYFGLLMPTLQSGMSFFWPVAIECLGTRIDSEAKDGGPLAPNQFWWFDCNAFNGFTYYYAVTTYDRAYECQSGRQGLVKVDNCEVGQVNDEGEPLPYMCTSELRSLTVQVDAQKVLRRVYVVPNPYRRGGSRATTPNYHNFPDDKIRFVNVPPICTIKVFTVAGDLVWEKEHNDLSGNIEWDGRNLGKREVASGVYIYRVVDPGGNGVYGRLVVIR